MNRAQKHPLLARLVVTFLGTILGAAFTFVAWCFGAWIGSTDIQVGVVMMFPLTSAWMSAALVQNLVDRG